MTSITDKAITISIFALIGAFILPVLGSVSESKAIPKKSVSASTGEAVIEEPLAATPKRQRPILCLEWIEAKSKDGNPFAVCTDNGKHIIATRYRVVEMLASGEKAPPGNRLVKALVGWR